MGEGFVSKQNVVRLLETYRELAAGSPTGEGGNSGPKAYDGVTGGRLNLIMLNQALEQLREALPASYRCIDAMYLRPIMRRESLKMLGVKYGTFRRLVSDGVTFLYFRLNGQAANVDLLQKALRKSAKSDRA